MENLEKESDSWKTSADELIEKTQIISDLSRYGDVHVSGAYTGNVMMHGDDAWRLRFLCR